MQIYAELYASGNGDEEFWVGHLCPVVCLSSAELLNVQYDNIADAYLGDLPADTTYGGGPFREVRLLVDGQVAGVAFPYAVIFTGGINPAVWRWELASGKRYSFIYRVLLDLSLHTARSTFRPTF